MEFDENMEEILEDDIEGYSSDDNINEEDVHEKEINSLKNEIQNYKERLMRTTAEYDNFRKRTDKEKLQMYSNAMSKAILSILPVVDSLEMAEKSAEGGSESYKKGLLMVKAQFNEALSALGVKPFGEVGDTFNPDVHNAVSHIEDEKNEEENVVSEVFQKGYKLQDKVIRHAMVQVTN